MTAPTPITLSVDGISCASCVGRIDRGLQALDGIRDVSVNLATGTARFTPDDPAGIRTVTQSLDTLGYPARRATVTLNIAAMSCASCVGRVERALAGVHGVESVSVNLATETAQITYFAGATDPAELMRVSTAAGYGATRADAEPATSTDKHDATRILARRTVIAAALALPVFLIEMGGHLIPALHMLIQNSIGQQASWLIQFVLTTAVLIGPGQSFFRKGLPALIKGAPDMNSLVAMGTGAAYGYSVIATFLPGLIPTALRAVYYEAAAVIIVLILIGRWLEAGAKGRTGTAIQNLIGLRAKTALVMRDGTAVETPIDAIVTGDLVVVRPGGRLAVDGVVVAGDSHVNESMITGEPVPLAKSMGDAVTGGTINGTGSLTFRATRVGADTTLSQIIRMVQEAQGAKLPIQGMVDRITLWFVPAILALALVTVLVWLVLGPTPALSHALVAGVSVLIIACPCAMGLATPTSIMVGTGRAAEMGVLFRKGDALQQLGKVGVVALDKTGTLTLGHPELTDLVLADGYDRASVLASIAAVEAHSEHPIAAALVRAARADGLTLPAITGFRATPGFGVRAEVNGAVVLIGAARWMAQHDIDLTVLGAAETTLAENGRTALFAAIDGRVVALLGLADPLKPSSRAAVAALQALGLRVAMVTGDRPETAHAIARSVGIDDVIAGVLPDGKVAAINGLRRAGETLAFVGDGINDAPALAHADVGIAIGTGTDIAIESADVVLMSGDLRGVVNAMAVSRRTMTNIRQNLGWAFGYNVALVPVAAGVLYPAFGVLLSPVLAAGAMAASSVFVITNALRLRRIKPAMAERAMSSTGPTP